MRLPAAAKVAAPAANWRTAALETLAQAQSLWSAGSHTAAIELRGQAFSRVENTTPLGTPVVTQSPFASLARELARMQLADGQVGRQTAAAGEWARKARCGLTWRIIYASWASTFALIDFNTDRTSIEYRFLFVRRRVRSAHRALCGGFVAP